MQWEGLNEVMVDSTNQAERLLLAFEPLESAPLQDVLLELKGWKERAEEARARIEDFVLHPEEEYVYWVTLSGADSSPTLSAAPLEVGPKLHEMLFSQKRSVILTSATLSVDGSLDYMAESVGLEEADRLIVGSPFDYKTSTLVLTVPDIPEAIRKRLPASCGGRLDQGGARLSRQPSWTVHLQLRFAEYAPQNQAIAGSGRDTGSGSRHRRPARTANGSYDSIEEYGAAGHQQLLGRD